MNFTPQQVDQMSLYQFACCVEGWNKAQGGEEPLEPLSIAEYEADMIKAAEQRGRNRLN